jgi:hypothetical protein
MLTITAKIETLKEKTMLVHNQKKYLISSFCKNNLEIKYFVTNPFFLKRNYQKFNLKNS